ncbi:hypothetical protein HPP92_006145 [Vanilla planifolia]|uniref:Choline transporter-like protein n=1 Tax=Vanilla planifolia TaxID=51239 RepID=A0A835RVD5_VANPL|nr:hypothetical protein HPP92_006145 [Vanilla planifolia]
MARSSVAVFSDSDGGSSATAEEEEDGREREIRDSPPPVLPSSGAEEPARRWRDVFWLFVFVVHVLAFGSFLFLLGMNRFGQPDRLNIDRFTNITAAAPAAASGESGTPRSELTETFWPLYGVAGGVGAALAWGWLALMGSCAGQMMKVSVHILVTYLAVLSVLCFWGEYFFWGVAFAVGAALQFLYVMSVLDRVPFTMLVLQKAVNMVWDLPEVMRVAYAFLILMLSWMVLWSFGVSGIIASKMDDSMIWWLLVIFSVSLFWTGAVLCNTVHVIVSGMVFLVLIHGGRRSTSITPKSLLKSLRFAMTTSFGSICYGSLFTAAIRTLRWEIAVNGKGFNHSARDAWELFQSTGVEALVAYDCSGAVLLMGIILGGLVAGTCTGVWAWFKTSDDVLMVGSTAILMGMVLVGLAVVVVESAVTSIYICYAEDPSLIHRWDAEFFEQMSEALHQRLQYRSARARHITTNRRLDQTNDDPDN